MNKIKVILVDDHNVVRAGFRMLLAVQDTIEVIDEAERGEQACQLFFKKQPDVLVLDLSMPGIGGLESIRRICQRNPDAKILVFSVHDEQVYVKRAMSAGARGYITKNSAPNILVEAIKAIASGKIYIERALTMPKVNQDTTVYQSIVDTLSPREFDVFRLLAKGLTAQNVARQLCISYKTAANYGTQIRIKLNVSTAAELAHIALLVGVVKN